MDDFRRTLAALTFLLFAGNVFAQAAPQLKKPLSGAQLGVITTPSTTTTTVTSRSNAANPAIKPGGVGAPAVDTEGLVQSEIKRLEKQRDDINKALAKVGATYSKLTYSPNTGNSCIDPDTTWNTRSGESFACVGMTTCIARMARWSKSRTNPCEPGAVIDSCVTSDECKAGSLCDTGKSKCVHAPGS